MTGTPARMLILAGVAAGLLGPMDRAQAQGSVTITPWFGMYVPTQNSYSLLGTDIKRRNSFIGGGRLTFWGKSPVGLELSAGLAPARTRRRCSSLHQSW